MTATLQQMLAEPKPLLDLARSGEDVVLTDEGEPVVRLTGVAAQTRKPSPEVLDAWLDRIARHAIEASTGKTGGPTTEEIIDDLRSERC